MKYLYFLVDCSGSVVSGDSTLVGQLNDLLRDAAERLADMAEDMFVFTYADEAELYWTYSKEQTFYDIPLDKFGGRSSLGKCYAAVVKHMETLGVDIADAVLVLVSDGEATDNYKRASEELDPKHKAVRVGLTLGKVTGTTERHASSYSLSFNNGFRDREKFLDKLDDLLGLN